MGMLHAWGTCETNHLGDLGVNLVGTVILEWLVRKFGVDVWTEFICLRIDTRLA
jgi:hypothetical protein